MGSLRRFISIFKSSNAEEREARVLSNIICNILGSWVFIKFQLWVIGVWIVFNCVPLWKKFWFDPFPFSNLSSLLQIQGVITAAFILMSSNDQSKRDSQRIEEDLRIAKHLDEKIDELVELHKVSRK